MTEYTALPPDVYGNRAEAGLRIIQQNASRELDGGVTSYSFLVGSTNGVDGTAFFNLHLRQSWLSDESMCLAFNKGEPHGDAPNATTDTINTVREALRNQAHDAVVAAGTPEDQIEESVEIAFNNLLTRIQINVGQLNRIKNWAGFTGPIDLTDLSWLSVPGNAFTGEGGASTEFSGKIVTSNNGNNSEVKSIIGKV